MIASGATPSQSVIWPLEPVNCCFVITEKLGCQGNQTRQAIKSIGFVACETALALPTLQAAQRKIKTCSDS
jgi:hypothetical protein